MTGPVSRVDHLRAYQRTPLPAGVTLRLDANEGQPTAEEVVLAALREGGSDLFRRYPDTRALEAQLAAHYGIDASRVFVSAGADDVIDRCCRAYLFPGSTLLVAEPGFEMFDHYAALAGGHVAKAAWAAGAYPIDAMLANVGEQTRVIAFVTPNNPTGEVATFDDLLRLSTAAPDALVILDHAYADFADEDLTARTLDLPNVLVVRTFSKAWGLAGCRVGYALGPASLARSLRAAGGPFPAAAPSLAIAAALFKRGRPARDTFVRRIRVERAALYDQLVDLGARPRRSQANFVFAEVGDRSVAVQKRLVELGVLVRMVTARGAPIGLRISLPGDIDGFAQLTSAITYAFEGGQTP
jgi:histidinol-phosphate aminotransferase